MSMIAVIGQFDMHAEDAERAGELMRLLMNETVKEQGCLHYAYSRDLSNANRFQLSEVWESGEALAGHLQMEHIATYRAGMAKLRVLHRMVRRYEVSGVSDL